MNAQSTVFVVDDDPDVRKSLGSLFDSVGQPFETYSTANEFLQTYHPAKLGCLVLDVRMPGMSGIELHKHLLAARVTLPVIVISGHGDIQMAIAAIQRGAIDFMEKPVRPQDLLDRIQHALTQDVEQHQAKEEDEAIAARLARLTRREREVADLVIDGLNNKQIATRLGVSSQAIDVQRSKMMKKMHVKNVPELVKLMVKCQAAPVQSGVNVGSANDGV
mgnify:CR=1 FL=1